jgi:transposase
MAETETSPRRTDLRIVGPDLVVTRGGGIPLTWHAYPADKPDVTQFATMIGQLAGRYEAIAAACCDGGTAGMAVVLDAGQNSEDNFAYLAGTGLHYVGQCPPPAART